MGKAHTKPHMHGNTLTAGQVSCLAATAAHAKPMPNMVHATRLVQVLPAVLPVVQLLPGICLMGQWLVG